MRKMMTLLGLGLAMLSASFTASAAGRPAQTCKFQYINCTYSCVDDLACWDACSVTYNECLGVGATELSLPDLSDSRAAVGSCSELQGRVEALNGKIAQLQAALKRAAPADKPEIAEAIRDVTAERDAAANDLAQCA